MGEDLRNPGTMGPFALPPLSAEAPVPPEKITIRLEAAGAVSKNGDLAATPAFRAEVPFLRRASLIFDGTPVEAWKTSADSGVSKGDIRFGAKFLIVDGGETKPSIAARFVTKTTTGKDEDKARFTNAPGYYLDVLAGWKPTKRVELDAAVGFFAWQQGERGQNDAVTWALSAKAPLGDLELAAGARGYVGWQTNDKPVQLGLSAGYKVSDAVRVVGGVQVGVKDAPLVEARLGIEVALPPVLPIHL